MELHDVTEMMEKNIEYPNLLELLLYYHQDSFVMYLPHILQVPIIVGHKIVFD
jgi:hypothetical protein